MLAPAALLLIPRPARAQEPIGRVRIADAEVSGALVVSGDVAVLRGAATVVARDHTAEVHLQRGGEVQVCSTSSLHVAQGPSAAGAPAPLLLALDRGAVQVHTAGLLKDAVITPDLRLTVRRAGLLDLGLRVTSNGDTCVENSGSRAPVLDITEQMGDASYELHPGQHVLFEHGSLREVVDHETSPCGCPPVMAAPPPPVSVAGSGLPGTTPTASGSAIARQQAEASNPFPAAESQGLAPAPAIPQAPPGDVHAQVGATLAYGDEGTNNGSGNVPAGAAAPDAGGDLGRVTAPAPPGSTASASGTQPSSSPASTPPTTPSPAASPARAAAAAPSSPAHSAPAPAAPPPGGIFHRIGSFFRHLFG